MFREFLDAGKLSGAHIEIEREEFDRLNAKWFPGPKIGSLLHTVLAVPAKAIDSALGTNLASCGECAGRELHLNAL